MSKEPTVYHSGMARLAIFLCIPAVLSAGAGVDLMRALRDAALDPAQCYRVRELSLGRDEAQIFFTDGYLIFGKPVNGSPVTAVFTSDVEGGDAEVLLLPPNRGERRELAKHTGSPNMEEHFTEAALLFADDTYRQLLDQIQSNPYIKKSPEIGALMTDRWSPVVRNLSTSFGLRMAIDLISPSPHRKGFFAAALNGKKLGTFDVIFDNRGPEQIIMGQNGMQGFDIWSSFTSRSFRGKTYQSEFKLSDYRIDTVIDADLKLTCVTRIALETFATERALPFEISRQMQIKSATVDGLPAEVLTSDLTRSSLDTGAGNDAFAIIPQQPFEPGQVHEIEIRHEGKVVSDAGNKVYYVGSRGSWYPSRGFQFAKYDLTFHSPADLDLVASGDSIEDRIEGGQRITHRTSAVPIRMAGFNLGVYERTKVKRGALTIEICANRSLEKGLQPKPVFQEIPGWPPGNALPRRTRGTELDTLSAPLTVPRPSNPADHLQDLALEFGDVMDFFTARFGPLTLASLEVSPVPGRFGQGFPGMIYLSTLSYLDANDRPIAAMDPAQRMFFQDLLHAHEAAHQWWGNIVTSAAYHDEWILEALANYSAVMFVEKRRGTRAAEIVLEDYRQHLLQKTETGATRESAGPVVQGTRLDREWSVIVYGKGTWIIHMLRRRLGDAAFLRMLASLRRTFDDKTISTEQFRLFVAGFLPPKSADPKLEAFFDQWVYGTGIPELKLNYSIKGAAPLWKVTGTVTQTGVDEDFTSDVPIEIRLGRLKPIAQTVRASSEPAAFATSTKALPTKVVIDTRAILSK